MRAIRWMLAATTVVAVSGSVSAVHAGIPFRREPDSLRTVTVNGTTLHYLDVGQGEPVVLIHGMAGDYRAWRGQIAALSKRYRVIAYSRRWHHPNNGGGEADYTMGRHILDLLAMMDLLNITPAHLIGHAYGAQMAAAIARDHPEDVRSVVLVEPALMGLLSGTPEGAKFQSEQRENYLRAQMSLRDGFPDMAVRAMVDYAYGWPGYESFSSKEQELLKDNVDALGRQINAKKPDPPFVAADARRIHAPVLFVEGQKSPEMRHKVGDAFLAARPATERVVVNGASHGVPWDATGAFNKAVLKFLEAHSGSGVAAK
jgi:pimeloyl-ACP methyl ester carboxylesterase